MTEIKNIEEKIILFEEVVNNDHPKTIESLTNNFTPIYHSILSSKTLTLSTHPTEFNKLLVSIKLLIQDSDFDLLGLS